MLTCRTQAVCTGGGWTITAPTGGAACAAPASGSCPATPPAPNGACTTAGLRCGADDRSCACTMLGGSLKWLCDVQTNADPACPALLPNAGSACAARPAPFACQYGGCAVTGELVRATCPGGVWLWTKLGCTGGGALPICGDTASTCDPATAAACLRSDGATCSCGRRCSGVAPRPEDPYYWSCESARPIACPAQPPANGAPCSAEATTCGWGTCGWTSATCTGGTWKVVVTPPPP